MNNILEELFSEHIRQAINSFNAAEPHGRLEKNLNSLKSHLNKKERRLLLRIIDDKNLINGDTVSNCFIDGFKLGLKVGYESNKG